ncbi:MAG TPA: response regulator transcription factor [Solirubrobacteraceae bacterium]|nr:response regulator transcription factor [Solirubrobacteraceae bacterium]
MRILVVEDEPRISDFLALGLEAEGYRVDTALDGPAGLERALAGDHALVILDLLLPGMNGLAVLRELQRQRPGLPVLILSARADLPIKLRGFELGAADYVGKPFSIDELIARVRVQLRRTAAGDRAVCLRCGELELDVVHRRASVGPASAELTDREFRLLHELARQSGEVVSREQLLADVWGYDGDASSNVVDVCVRRLRKKLGAQIPIETVRNVGYRLAG